MNWNSLKRVRAFQIELESGIVVFLRRGEVPEYAKKNLSEEGREPTTNSTQIWHVRYSRIRTGPHWWEASAVTTASDLLPMRDT